MFSVVCMCVYKHLFSDCGGMRFMLSVDACVDKSCCQFMSEYRSFQMKSLC